MTHSEFSFPDGFLWGAATSAYQVEGGVKEGGRGESTWDAFAHMPGKTDGGATGDVAIDHYHRFKEDVQLMKQIGLKVYRFSIAWPRIMPNGVGEVSEEGVKFYSDLINELLAKDITPFVTLYHWDLPLALFTEYDGWLGEHIHKQFADYARVCFERFGDRVKNWITLNEPWVHSIMSYCVGVHAPGRKINRHTEPYIVGHNLLLAHAHAVDVYRKEFQEVQGGQIGITLSGDWRLPAPSDDPKELQANVEAAGRSIVFHLGWFADPIFLGDYPQLMKDRVGDRLPKFTDEQKELVKGSSDFLGLNNYGSAYATPSKGYVSGVPAPSDRTGSFFADEGTETVSDPSWGKTAVPWFDVTPWGMYHLLTYIHKTYQPKNGIVITENGSSWVDTSREEALEDNRRIDFLEQYLASVHKAIQDGADVRGYCVWSLFDNLRWANGYSTHFGLIRVDFDKGLERTLKKSAHWYHDTIAKNGYAVDRVLPNTTAAITTNKP